MVARLFALTFVFLLAPGADAANSANSSAPTAEIQLLEAARGEVRCTPTEASEADGTPEGWYDRGRGNCHDPVIGGDGATFKRCFTRPPLVLGNGTEVPFFSCGCHLIWPGIGAGCVEEFEGGVLAANMVGHFGVSALHLWMLVKGVPLFYYVVYLRRTKKFNAANVCLTFQVLGCASEVGRSAVYGFRALMLYGDDVASRLYFFLIVTMMMFAFSWLSLSLAWVNLAEKARVMTAGETKVTLFVKWGARVFMAVLFFGCVALWASSALKRPLLDI